MMFDYSPRIEHWIMPALLAAAGEGLRLTTWSTLGWVFYGLAGLACLMIGYALVAEVRRAERMISPAGETPSESFDRSGPGSVDVSLMDGSSMQRYQLPATAKQLEALADGLLNKGQGFSQRAWTGLGRPLSIDGFKTLRAEMVRRGLACLVNSKDPRQGYGLTKAGERIMKKFLPSPTAPGFEAARVDR